MTAWQLERPLSTLGWDLLLTRRDHAAAWVKQEPLCLAAHRWRKAVDAEVARRIARRGGTGGGDRRAA